MGLALGLLRAVNAPSSGLGTRCTGVHHAVALLGLKPVTEVVTGAAALAFVEQVMGPHPALAAHALASAGVARLLAPRVGVPSDEAFTAALSTMSARCWSCGAATTRSR